MSHKSHLTFFEYSGAVANGVAAKRSSLKDLNLDHQQFAELLRLSREVRPGVRLLDIDGERVKAKQYVGCMAGEKLIIEVLPKLLKNRSGVDGDQIVSNLSFMLELAYDLKINDSGIVDSNTDQASFIESYISLYAKRILRRLRRGGFPKKYVTVVDELRTIRGRIDLAKQVCKRFVDDSKITCIYDEYSDNWTLNQAIKYTCSQLIGVTRNLNSERVLASVIDLMEQIEPRWYQASDLNAQTAHIRDREMRALIRLTEMFLSGMRPSLKTNENGTNRNGNTFGLVFDMNELFESFIHRVLVHMRSDLDEIEITAQKRVRIVEKEMCKDANEWASKERFNTFSDILITPLDGRQCVVIDTKYKLMDLDSEHFGISNSDVYQILAYELIHRQVGRPVYGILLYPQSGDKPVRMKYQTRGGQNEFAVATIDLGRDLRRGLKEIQKELKEILAWVGLK